MSSFSLLGSRFLTQCRNSSQFRHLKGNNNGLHLMKSFQAFQQQQQQRGLSSEGFKVSAGMVKELRERSGSPIMDCKKALADDEVRGDMDKAIEWLRKRGVAIAQKKMGRAMNEGLVGVAISPDQKAAAVVEVSSETDFVARNAVFQELVKQVSQTALDNKNNTIEELLQAKGADMEDASIQDAVVRCTAAVAENLSLKHVKLLQVENGFVGKYVHNKQGDNCGGQVSLVAVELDKPLEDDSQQQIVKSFADNLALHLVGAQARFLDVVPKDVLEKERDIEMERLVSEAQEKAKADNKEVDPEVLKKRASKKVDKVLKKLKSESILLEQDFVSRDGSQSGKVSQVINKVGKSVNAKLSISSAVRFQVGAEEQAILEKLK